VFRRSLAILLALACLLALGPAALAARVHVRVEGKTRTIFGPTEPVLDAPATALDALEAASVAGEFYYHVKVFSFGPFVDQIGRYAAAGADGWVFKVNGASPEVGADKVTVKDGDTVLWYFATFAGAAGPPTLELKREGKRCYRVVSRDDKGVATVAAGAVLRVDGRSVKTKRGRVCLRGRHGLVRATLGGAVRSNALG
jgi:Domain of unknown function (DUF4430)